MPTDRIYKLSFLCLSIVALLLPAIGYYASQLSFGTTFVENWLPGEDSARASYREFRQRFGDDQFLIVCWPTCTYKDERLAEFSERLRTLQAESPEFKILSILNSSELVERLVENGVEREVAIERLRGFMIGQNGNYIITLKLEQSPVEVRARLVEEIRVIAKEVLNYEAKLLVLAGEPFQIYMIDRTSREAMEQLVIPSSLLALAVAWACIRSYRLTLLVFAFAGLGQLIGMATVSFFLEEMIAVLVVLPTLVFMLTLSAAVHLANYLKDCRVFGCHIQKAPPNRNAGADALRMGAAPCFLATLTTVFGLGSLFLSQLSPVWHFGSLSAFALLSSSIILLTAFPAASRLMVWKTGNKSNFESETPTQENNSSPQFEELEDGAPHSETMASAPTSDWITATLALLTRKLATPITAAGLILLAFAFVGLTKLQTSTEFEDMFSADNPAIRNLKWVERYIGPIDSLEFLVTIDSRKSDESSEAERVQIELELLNKFQGRLANAEEVDSTFSAITLLPDFPTASGTRGTIQRAVFRRFLFNKLDQFEQDGLVFAPDANSSDANRTWRITARVADMRGDNYVEIRDRLLADVDQYVVEQGSLGLQVDYELTGLRTVVEKAHHALITDLVQSFLMAFALITPVMMLIVRGPLSGLILMIPNVLPVAFVFGCMGWLGVKLDVASILTASVALGIAVDDTLHFVTWFFRSRRSGLDANQSVHRAIRACARPMLNTTIICSAAMFPFFFAEFTPTSKFALLMILILSGAILGDLLLLPALLQSPLGRWIGTPKNHGTSINSAENGSSV